jgi:hypothetical protein
MLCGLITLLGLAFASVAWPASAGANSFPAFKTPDEAAYCEMEFPGDRFDTFRCFTPNDGFWIRFTGIYDGRDVHVTKGYDDRYRGYRSSAYSLLRFGEEWASSDARMIVCKSRRSGLTCKHWDGLTFWLGRYRGYRIYVGPAGERPQIARPLFWSSPGVYCGIGASLEPANPTLVCWQARNGLVLSVSHDNSDRRGSWDRNENARGYRPTGYQSLDSPDTFFWRCTNVTEFYAEHCSRGQGTAVFTCETAAGRLTCQSRAGHGFWFTGSSFYTF